MARTLTLLMLALCPLFAAAQDNAGTARLEQEVRQLQREVLNLTQLLNELRARVERPTAAMAPPLAAPPRTTGGTTPANPGDVASPRWLSAQRWASLRPGMSELEIVEILGPPTSMRAQESGRVLLYAMEIGSAGFLAGSVTLRDRAAAAIETPRLK